MTTSPVTWEGLLPLREEHKLTEEAAEQLAAIVAAGVPVGIGKPRPGEPGALGSDEPRAEPWIGRSISGVREGIRVRVTVELFEGDAARAALEGLRAGTLGLGLDGRVRTAMAGKVPDPYQDVTITGVQSVTCVAVVPMAPLPGEERAPQWGSQVRDGG